MSGIGGRNKLGDESFVYRTSKGGEVFVLWHGRRGMTLTGEAARFLSRIAGADGQLVMEKVTGTYKRGNER